MKLEKTSHRLFLLAALVLVLGAFLAAGSSEAFENLPGQSWDLTPTAVERTAAGDCPTGMLCRELCFLGAPQGEFHCFNN